MGLPQASLSRQRPGPKRDSNGATPVKVAVQFGSLGRQNRGFLLTRETERWGPEHACLKPQPPAGGEEGRWASISFSLRRDVSVSNPRALHPGTF